MSRPNRNEAGFALIAVLMLVALLAALLGAHFIMTRADLSTTKSAMDHTRGFYAAEAGLNLRAKQIRATFEGYNLPGGTPPPDPPGTLPCELGTEGSGDFGCQLSSFSDRDVRSFVEEDPTNPVAIRIPPGDTYQNLNAVEYRYTVTSMAVNTSEFPEAILEMRFRSRLVPLFQFAAFYNKDLEVFPGPPMTLDGPVHCNGDLYAGADNELSLIGQVTVATGAGGAGGRLYNGRKYDDCCSTANPKVFDGASVQSLPAGAGRHLVTDAEQTPWNGWIRSGLDPLTVPPPEVLDPSPGEIYWDNADLRVVLNLDALPGDEIELRRADGTKDGALSSALNACGGSLDSGTAVAYTDTMYDRRERTDIEMLEVDVVGLLDCVHGNAGLMGGKLLSDTTHGGLVWYLGVERADTPTGSPSDFGVRVRNGASLASGALGAPEIKGLTVVTNQAVYILGDYNSDIGNWKPAAFLSDSLNVLSNAWDDATSPSAADDEDDDAPVAPPGAADTAIYAGFLAGTDSTGGVEQSPISGADKSIYNGGLENYPRFHEDWTGRTMTYRGSFISLSNSRHVAGTWNDEIYDPPDRDWGFEQRFKDAANLPPLSPRFVYLTQELFVREFDY